MTNKTKITKTSLAVKGCRAKHRYELRNCEDNSILKIAFAWNIKEAREIFKNDKT